MSLTGRVGLGPVAYQVDPIRKCDEKVIDSCKTSHRCCAVISCEYCLEWIPYGEEPILGSASSTDDGGITGEVNGMQFRAEWQREVYANACQLWVYVDDVLQAIIPLCGDTGVTCRNLSYSLGQLVTQNDEEGYETEPGELVWTRKEKRPLPYRKDETLCTQHFCGNCECTCRTLCATIYVPMTPGEPESDVTCKTEIGEIPYSSDCSGPVWGEVVVCDGRTFDLEFSIGRDEETGDCIFIATSNYDTFEFPLADCNDIDFTITVEDGVQITVVCADCGCEEEDPVVTCCFGRNLAGELSLTILNTETGGLCGEIQGPFALTEGSGNHWYGTATAQREYPDAGGEACFPVIIEFDFYCDGGGPSYALNYRVITDGIPSVWCAAIKEVDDCTCPYMGLWRENQACGLLGGNGVFKFLIEEPEDACE